MLKNKDLKKENQVQVESFRLSEEFLDDKEMFFERMSQYHFSSFGRLFRYLCNNGYSAQISNQELAQLFGASIGSVNRWLRHWERHGLIIIEKTKSPVKTVYGMGSAQRPNRYTLHPYFKTPEAEQELGGLFPFLKHLSLSLLMVTGSLFSHGNLFNANYVMAYNKAFRLKEYTKDLLRAYSREERRVEQVEWCLRRKVAKRLARRLVKNEREVLDPMAVVSQVPLRIRQVKVIKLTPMGMMRLMCFPDEAIDWAEKQMVSSKKFIFDVFRYFVGLCKQYCMINNIEPDYAKFNKLKDAYGYRDDKPMVHVNAAYRNVKISPVTPPQRVTQKAESGVNTHPLPESESSALPVSGTSSQSSNNIDFSKIPQTGKSSVYEQTVDDLLFEQKNTALPNSNSQRKKGVGQCHGNGNTKNSDDGPKKSGSIAKHAEEFDVASLNHNGSSHKVVIEKIVLSEELTENSKFVPPAKKVFKEKPKLRSIDSVNADGRLFLESILDPKCNILSEIS